MKVEIASLRKKAIQGSIMENDSSMENNNNADGKSGCKEYKNGASMIDDGNADNDSSVSKEEANENGGRNVKENTDMK